MKDESKPRIVYEWIKDESKPRIVYEWMKDEYKPKIVYEWIKDESKPRIVYEWMKDESKPGIVVYDADSSDYAGASISFCAHNSDNCIFQRYIPCEAVGLENTFLLYNQLEKIHFLVRA